MERYKKIIPYLVSDATPISGKEKLRSAIAAFIAILMVTLISREFLSGTGLHVLVASMGASAVLLFATPHSPLAQPWPVIGGHLLSGLVGLICVRLIPEFWFATAAAVGISILLMHLAHCLHPPGGASAIAAVYGLTEGTPPGLEFLAAPLALNALSILLLALAINNLMGRRYPARPQMKTDLPHRHRDPSPLGRLGIEPEDLHKALQDLDVFLDVSENDLEMVYNRAGLAAAKRRIGALTCSEIMTRDVPSVEFATELEEAWTLLHTRHAEVLPVVNRARRVIGVVALADFIRQANLTTHDTFADKLARFIRRTPGHYADKPEVVGQIMASPAVTVPESAHVLELVPVFSNTGLHHVPVVNAEDRLVGMVTQSDLIAALYHTGVREPDAVK